MTSLFQLARIEINLFATHRGLFLSRVLSFLLRFALIYFLWSFLVHNTSTDFASLLAYFWVAGLLNLQFEVVDCAFAVSTDIRMGRLDAYIIRPLGYLSLRIMSSIFASIPYLAFALFGSAGAFLVLGIFNFESMAVLLLFSINTTIGYCLCMVSIGLLSFRLKNINGLKYLWTFIFNLLSGFLIPFSVLPHGIIRSLLENQPMALLGFWPVSAIVSNIALPNILLIWCLQIGLNVVLLMIAILTYSSGMRRYESALG